MNKDLMLERIVKAIINWNGQDMNWDSAFLKLQDHFDLLIKEDEDGIITLSTKIK